MTAARTNQAKTAVGDDDDDDDDNDDDDDDDDDDNDGWLDCSLNFGWRKHVPLKGICFDVAALLFQRPRVAFEDRSFVFMVPS